MENKLNLPLKKKKNEAESPRLDPLMRALKALHSAGAPENHDRGRSWSISAAVRRSSAG